MPKRGKNKRGKKREKGGGQQDRQGIKKERGRGAKKGKEGVGQ